MLFHGLDIRSFLGVPALLFRLFQLGQKLRIAYILMHVPDVPGMMQDFLKFFARAADF